MATNPGFMTDWPWKPLGSFKYALLAPWVAHSLHSFTVKGLDVTDFEMVTTLFLLVRDDQIILQSLLFYWGNMIAPKELSKTPIWRSDGVVLMILLHAGPVEFLYYWLHRALHHSYLFTRYHSHHHSSIVTQPISAVIHPFAEIISYFVLFVIPIVGVLITGRISLVAAFGYILYIDFMNNLGHCNFEIIPTWFFSIFPPLKYLMYTPSFHSLHHTQFRTNYSLFMPFYDYIYNTWDHSSDKLHHSSLQKAKDLPNLVHLSHFTTPNSIYQYRLGYSSLSSSPQSSDWYLWILWPFTTLFMLYSRLFGHTIVQELNYFDKVKSQTWVIPRFQFQYRLKWERRAINHLIEEAILETESQGCKVLSLGLLNQAEEVNENGELFIKKKPDLKVKLVDGSGLAAAVVLNSIPKGTFQILFTGKLTKVAKAILNALCQSEIQIAALHEDEYKKIKQQTECSTRVVLQRTYHQKVWLVGDELREEDQLKAAKGTIFIPYSQFPPKPIRKDCFYHTTPAMLAPASLKNLDSCENWLPRRVMSAWRIAGLIHALEDWNVNECGDTVSDIQTIWKATLHHGFRPLAIPNELF